jgi:hypothetical protein
MMTIKSCAGTLHVPIKAIGLRVNDLDLAFSYQVARKPSKPSNLMIEEELRSDQQYHVEPNQ